jgi:hypothetical protein
MKNVDGPIQKSICAATIFALIFAAALFVPARLNAETVALWLFDEQVGIYPSCVLGDASQNNYPLVLGPGGQIAIELSPENRYIGFERRPQIDPSRKMPPMDWASAKFCALMTRGEHHLRQEVGFPHATETGLNLGDKDWTVEFWYNRRRSARRE